MFSRIWTTLFVVPMVWAAAAQAAPLSYYLPADETYDPKIPTPEVALGYEVVLNLARPDLIAA